VISTYRNRASRFALMSAAALGAVIVASAASAQTAPAPADTATAPTDAATSQPAAAMPDDAAQDIVVTGIRASLQSATNAKKNSIGFGDSIFAEDIGKLPATNLAETLNRIPGVRLNRDINGEGTQVAIRGLGASFSKVLLNGSQIAIASDGGTNGGSTGREVDLDLFPSELFTRLDVSKSAQADQIEGGIAGTVNLHNARPFDNPGDHVTVVAQGQYTDSNFNVGPRGAIVASHTGDTWGVLVGVSGVSVKTRVDGYETVGFTDGNLPRTDATGKAITDLGGNGFNYASVVPNNTGHGLVAGAPLNIASTSGLTTDQLRTALIPRLGRNSLTEGTRSRISVVGSFEWRPSDDLHFALDGIWANSKRDYTRLNMNWYVRNSGPGTSPTSTGGMVPIGLTVDQNNVVTNGTFANSSFFLENDIFNQTTKFWNINPSMMWKPASNLQVDLSLNYSKSDFFREQPQFDFQTTPQSGLDVNYDNTSGNPQPIITSNKDLGDPNLGWRWYRVNVQNVERKTNTKGAHLDLTWGDSTMNLKGGFAYDTAYRNIRAYDNSSAFQTSVCGATCDGLSGSVPNSALAQYLSRSGVTNFGHLAGSSVGYTSLLQPLTSALESATNYASYVGSAPQAIGAVTGGATGSIEEKTYGGYVEANGAFQLMDRELRLNAGVRYFHTDQSVAGPTNTANGIIDVSQQASYDDFLPSFNLSYDVLHNLKVRLAASRSMTRADPGSLLPGLTFSDISAQVATAGNPQLKPYFSNNIDFGGEYYTGGIGYIGLDLFQKDISGFTVTQQNSVVFNTLGLNYSDLTIQQQQAITNRGGPDVAVVTVGQPVNLQTLRIRGIEATWVQPLDFLVKGLGYSVNGTHISQSSDSNLIAPGVAPWSYNLQGFYEGHGISLSLNYVWTDKLIAANAPQNNINVPLNADARGQLDLSAGYQLPFFNNAARITLDVLNITNEPIRTTFGYDNATYSVYYPGRQILFGIRGKF